MPGSGTYTIQICRGERVTLWRQLKVLVYCLFTLIKCWFINIYFFFFSSYGVQDLTLTNRVFLICFPFYSCVRSKFFRCCVFIDDLFVIDLSKKGFPLHTVHCFNVCAYSDMFFIFVFCLLCLLY